MPKKPKSLQHLVAPEKKPERYARVTRSTGGDIDVNATVLTGPEKKTQKKKGRKNDGEEKSEGNPET
jgi:hypothetical protein